MDMVLDNFCRRAERNKKRSGKVHVKNLCASARHHCNLFFMQSLAQNVTHAAQHVALSPLFIIITAPTIPHPIPDIQFNYSLLKPFFHKLTFLVCSAMADRDRPQPHQLQVHPQQGPRVYGEAGFKAPQRGPSATQILAVVTLLPVGGTLLGLAGLTLAGSLIGLALTTPLFIICSPVLVPAAAVLGLAVIGFLSSGAFGLTGLSSLSWVLNCFRQKVPDQMDYAKRRLQDTAAHMGQKTKEAGEKIQTKAQEAGRDQSGRELGK